jgi:hypothetical protein
MTSRLLRALYIFEFLVAVIAIFTAWSEIGGQAALDLMHWGWKLGLGFGLAGALVGYTAAVVSNDRVWTIRSARWVMIIVLLTLAIGVVTYYYGLQVEAGESDETSTMSQVQTCLAADIDLA